MNITCYPIRVVPVRENYINVVKPKTANDSWVPSKMLDDFICSDGKLGVVRCHHILFPQKPSVVGTWSETSEKSGADYEICTAQCSPIIRPLEISEHEEKKSMTNLTILLQICRKHTLPQCRTYLYRHPLLFWRFPTPVLGEWNIDWWNCFLTWLDRSLPSKVIGGKSTRNWRTCSFLAKILTLTETRTPLTPVDEMAYF